MITLLVFFLTLTSTGLASTTWYVDGVHGSDNNDCKSPQSACKTIAHAISLAWSGDSIMIAAATYKRISRSTLAWLVFDECDGNFQGQGFSSLDGRDACSHAGLRLKVEASSLHKLGPLHV
jgi:hypothetical protein